MKKSSDQRRCAPVLEELESRLTPTSLANPLSHNSAANAITAAQQVGRWAREAVLVSQPPAHDSFASQTPVNISPSSTGMTIQAQTAVFAAVGSDANKLSGNSPMLLENEESGGSGELDGWQYEWSTSPIENNLVLGSQQESSCDVSENPDTIYWTSTFGSEDPPEMRLSEINVSEEEMVRVRLVFTNFTLPDAMEIARHAQHIRLDCKDAVDWLNNNSQDITSENGYTAADSWFVGNDGRLSNGELNHVIAVYQGVADRLQNGSVSFNDNVNLVNWSGFVPGSNGADIDIGVPFHTHSDEDKYFVVIHELTHAISANWTTDHAYCDDTSVPVVWLDTATQQIDITENMTTGELIDNADSYAGFLTMHAYVSAN